MPGHKRDKWLQRKGVRAGWGDCLVSEVLAMQALGHEFGSPAPM